MNIDEAISCLNTEISNPTLGLPEELFLFISKTTPMVNVDLLINDEDGRVLLSWRDDIYAGKGWHLPGGIIRVQETLESRVKKVAENEIGVKNIKFKSMPLTFNQIIYTPGRARSHFISFLYQCFLPKTFQPENKGLLPSNSGYLQWHDHCPMNLVEVHEIYRNYVCSSMKKEGVK